MGRRTLIAVLVITAGGLALRLVAMSQSLFGDELSTLYLIGDRNLADLVSVVSSDAEITPPLYFILAWFATRLGDSPDLVRLPALLAGTGLIPLTWLLGTRAAGRPAGLLAAALVALAPFMVFFSATGRAYSLMLFALVLAALCLTRVERNGWWWVAWALAAAAAMYSHYTAVFVLAAQFIWALWAMPSRRRALLVATLGAVVLFLPWTGSLAGDLGSPTNEVLQTLQPTGIRATGEAVIQWAFGHPLLVPSKLPGTAVWLVVAAAAVLAAGAALWSHRHLLRSPAAWLSANPLLALTAAAALATPLGEAVLTLAGTELFGARNLAASWPFAALLLAFLVTRSGRWVAIGAGSVILAGLAWGTARSLTVERLPDYEAAARQIERQAGPGDSVLDLIGPAMTPAPLTPLGAQLDPPDGVTVFDVNQPAGEPPFLPLTPKPDPDRVVADALARSRGESVFVVGPRARVTVGSRAGFSDGNLEIPAGWRVIAAESYPGLADLNVLRLEKSGG